MLPNRCAADIEVRLRVRFALPICVLAGLILARFVPISQPVI